MKSIKLTLTDGRDFFVFVDKITDIIRKEKSEGSFVTLVGNDGSSVIETPEQILEQIENIRPKLKPMREEEKEVNGISLREFGFVENRDNSLEFTTSVYKVVYSSELNRFCYYQNRNGTIYTWVFYRRTISELILILDELSK